MTFFAGLWIWLYNLPIRVPHGIKLFSRNKVTSSAFKGLLDLSNWSQSWKDLNFLFDTIILWMADDLFWNPSWYVYGVRDVKYNKSLSGLSEHYILCTELLAGFNRDFLYGNEILVYSFSQGTITNNYSTPSEKKEERYLCHVDLTKLLLPFP